MLNKIFIYLLFFLYLSACSDASSSKWKMTKQSEGKHFSVNLLCVNNPSVSDFQNCQLVIVRLNADEPRLKKEGTDQLLRNAKISIDGGMPAHQHGLPTMPVVNWSDLDNRYLIEGLKFSMPGEWVLRFYINDTDRMLKDNVLFKFLIY